MRYIYTATFVPDPDGSKVYARIPDLEGCITTGKDLPDAIEQITDAASLWLVCAEDESDPIPEATPQDRIPVDAGAMCSLVQVDTIAYRARIDTRSVRKNVSLPAWMANLADQRKVNCSQVLQEALSKRFATG